MITLTNERIEQMLHEETVKKEEQNTILRAVYTRYMRLYENYFADTDSLDDESVAALKNYHEETRSLVKYYYMDIPQDICKCLTTFDNAYTEKLLGAEWHKYLFDLYKDFRDRTKSKNKSREPLKTEFAKQMLSTFYDIMDYVFRDGFGTNSQTIDNAVGGITKLLFGKDK